MAIAKKTSKKDRNIHPHSKVKKKNKKRVSKGHPLASLPKNHVDADDIEVVDDGELDDNDTSIDNISDTDVEAISDPNYIPTDFSDSILVDSSITVDSVATLDIPENISVDTTNVSYSPGVDGTYRASITVSFDEVFRASDYEVRISQ